MKILIKLAIVILLLSFIRSAYLESKPAFDIKYLTRKEDESFVFIKIKYNCSLKMAKSAELRVYALLRKRGKETVATGTISLAQIESGTYYESFMITPDYTENYGRPRKYRAEVWYKDRLAASKTKPRIKKGDEKWWEREGVGIIIKSDRKLEKMLRDYDD